MHDKEINYRIDKFLWSIRLFKTRSKAMEACKKEKIIINGNSIKPNRKVEIDMEFEIKDKIITRKYKIIQLLNNRVGAKLVENYVQEITSQEELLKLELFKNAEFVSFEHRKKGMGRPTKKERRDINVFKENTK